jgi:tellurite resistance protein
MPSGQQVTDETAGATNVASQLRLLLAMPPSVFAIPTGLAALAGVWRLAGELYHLPASIGDALYVVMAALYLLLLVACAMKLVLQPKAVLADLTHPVLSPFLSLLPISGMMLALGLQPYTQPVALVLFLLFFLATFLLGGWMTGQWVISPLGAEIFHPGYLLPTVAGGLVGAEGAGHFGLLGLGWMSFGSGVICWVILGSITLNRLFCQPGLPPGLVPTLAIEMAPPVLAGNAYFTLREGRLDLFAYILAGYALLMALMQVRLIPLYWKTPFALSFWAFTFPFAAGTSDALHWIAFAQPVAGQVLGYGLLAAITLLIGDIAYRSLIALRQGTFLLPAS